MKIHAKTLAPVLLALSLLVHINSANSDTVQNAESAGAAAAKQGMSESVPARRLRMRQMLERAQGGGALQGNSPKVEGQFAAIDANKVKVRRDLAYGTEGRQDLDVYSPAQSKSPVPIVFFVHGGGWEIGNKTNGHIDKGVAWAEHGVVFVSINYRLAPEVMHPKQIQDVAQAFAFVQKHASEFGGDPSKIFLMGHSAGAQLVDLLATNGKYLAEQGDKLTDIKGVISLDTASLNLQERIAEDSGEARLVGPMIKSTFGTNPAVLADASPSLLIKSGVAYPPFLMFCGKKRAGCCAQHEQFAASLKKAKGSVEIEKVPLNHGEISQAAGQPDSSIFKSALAFVQGKN